MHSNPGHESDSRSHNKYLVALALLACVVCIAWGAAFFWPKHWSMKSVGYDDRVEILLDEPNLSIIFLGFSSPGVTGHGFLPIAGLCFFDGCGTTTSGSKSFQTSERYAWGVAEIAVEDRVVRISSRGHVVSYRGETFNLPRDAPLRLVIDERGDLVTAERNAKQ